MKILVTGNLGYIGRVLTDYLIDAGHQVMGLDNGFFLGADFIPSKHQVDTAIKDVRDVTESDLAGVDAILHLAALSNDPLGFINPDVTLEINYRASVDLAKKAKQAGVKRFVFSSSCSMYGLSQEAAVTESAPFNPQTPYADSKVKTETELVQLASEEFSPVYLRNATLFGPSPRMRLDLVVNNLVAHAMTSGVIKIMSDGTPWRPLVHIQDVCQAFYLAATADQEKVHNQAFNVGSNQNNMQVKDIAQIVGQVVPNTDVAILGQGEPDTRSYKVSFDKITSQLGFEPKFTVRDGVEELFELFKEIKFSQADFDNPMYTTLQKIKDLQAAGKVDDAFRPVKE